MSMRRAGLEGVIGVTLTRLRHLLMFVRTGFVVDYAGLGLSICHFMQKIGLGAELTRLLHPLVYELTGQVTDYT